MDKQELYNWYNATCTDHPAGSDNIETYEHWLEKQLASRIDSIEELKKASIAKQNEQLIAFAMWLRKSNSIGDAEILVNAFKEETNCG